MRVIWQGLTLNLLTLDEPLRAAWAQMFDYELAHPAADAGDPPAAHFTARLADELPAEPDYAPLLDDPAQGVRVYGYGTGFRIYMGGAHYAAVTPATGRVFSVSLAEDVGDGRFEDLTTMALAPVLRRRGIYLIHAFSAAANGQALLLCGASGSGKTTTGLALCAAGMQLLANDIAALRRTNGQVQALFSPGSVHVTAHTLRLLPALRAHLLHGAPYKAPLSRAGLVGDAPLISSAPLTAVFFPQLDADGETGVTPLPRAVGLARLMAASIDRWDADTLDEHMALLAALSEQAAFYTLRLGPDLDEVVGQVSGSPDD